MVGLAVGAARRVPGRATRARRDIERACRARRARPARAIRRSSATRSATRSRRSIVRWHGRAPGRALPRAALPTRSRTRTPTALVTYVNYPDHRVPRAAVRSTSSASTSTSRSQERLAAYLARLQNLAGDRPLVMAEIGLDSLRQRRGAGRRSRSSWQVRTAFAAGLRRRVRLRLDRRVAPRRATTSTTGTSACVDRDRAAEAGARPPCAGRSPRCRSRATAALAADLGRRLHATTAQRTHPRLPRRPRRARLSRLRGDRRRRRLDRRDGRDRRSEYGVPADQHREPRPQPAPATSGSQRRDRRDRRLHRRRRLPRPALAALPRRRVRDGRLTSGVGGPNIPPPGDGRDRRVRRERAGRADPRAALRPARPSTSRAATWRSDGRALDGDRRLRPAVPDRRRRRRHLLAAAGARVDARLQPGRGRLASPAQLRARLLEAAAAGTARPRRCSSASGRSGTTGPATSPGRAGSTAARSGAAAGAPGSTTARGAATSSSRSTSARRALAALPLMPEWYLVIAGLAVLATVAAFGGHSCRGRKARRSTSSPCCSPVRRALLVLNALRGARASTRRAQRTSFPFRRSRVSVRAPAGRPARRKGALRPHALASPRRHRRRLAAAADAGASGASTGGPTARVARTARARSPRPVHGRRPRRRVRSLGHPRSRWSAGPPRACTLRSRSTGKGASSFAFASGPRWWRPRPGRECSARRVVRTGGRDRLVRRPCRGRWP